jgi:hypothetical protein
MLGNGTLATCRRKGSGNLWFPVEEGLGKPWVSQSCLWCRKQTVHKEAKK